MIEKEENSQVKKDLINLLKRLQNVPASKKPAIASACKELDQPNTIIIKPTKTKEQWKEEIREFIKRVIMYMPEIEKSLSNEKKLSSFAEKYRLIAPSRKKLSRF